MKIKILNEISYQIYPEIDGMIDIDATKEELARIGIDKCFDLKTNKIVDYTDGVKAKRIAELKELLASTDFQALKFAEGAITSEDYQPIKEARQKWREEIKGLEN